MLSFLFCEEMMVNTEIMTDPDALKEEGLQLFQRGELDNAVSTFETAVSAYAAEQNPVGQAEMFNNIGVIHRMRGNYDEALQALNNAAELCQQTDDVNRRAQVLGNMGDLYASMGDKETAARYYSDSAELFAQCGDAQRQSMVLKALSLLRLRQGQWMAAMMHMESSLSVRPRRGIFGSLFLGLIRFALSLFGGK
jgi:tetratricopeptide (TPR) repeat protein